MTRRYPEEWTQEIIREAAERYAAHDRQVSASDLMAAGRGANIPDRFMEEAIQVVSTRKRRFNSLIEYIKPFAIRSLIGGGTLVATIFFGKVVENIFFSKPIPSVSPEISSPVSESQALTSDQRYVRNIRELDKALEPVANRQTIGENKFVEVVVYREGKSGLVETMNCILPPDIKYISSLEGRIISLQDLSIPYGGTQNNAVTYYCEAVSSAP